MAARDFVVALQLMTAVRHTVAIQLPSLVCLRPLHVTLGDLHTRWVSAVRAHPSLVRIVTVIFCCCVGGDILGYIIIIFCFT